MTRIGVQSSASTFDVWSAAAQTATTQMNRTMQTMWGKAAEDQFEWMKLCLDYSGRQLEACLTFPNPMALLDAEAKVATEFSGKFMEQWQKDFALVQVAANEIMSCCKELSVLPTQAAQGEKSAPSKPTAVKSPGPALQSGGAEIKGHVA